MQGNKKDSKWFHDPVSLKKRNIDIVGGEKPPAGWLPGMKPAELKGSSAKKQKRQSSVAEMPAPVPQVSKDDIFKKAIMAFVCAQIEDVIADKEASDKDKCDLILKITNSFDKIESDIPYDRLDMCIKMAKESAQVEDYKAIARTFKILKDR